MPDITITKNQGLDTGLFQGMYFIILRLSFDGGFGTKLETGEKRVPLSRDGARIPLPIRMNRFQPFARDICQQTISVHLCLFTSSRSSRMTGRLAQLSVCCLNYTCTSHERQVF